MTNDAIASIEHEINVIGRVAAVKYKKGKKDPLARGAYLNCVKKQKNLHEALSNYIDYSVVLQSWFVEESLPIVPVALTADGARELSSFLITFISMKRCRDNETMTESVYNKNLIGFWGRLEPYYAQYDR